MKYEILIEGGFTGIPKEYEGEIELREDTKQSLFEALEREKKPENTALRDGLQYRLKLSDSENVHQARYDEKNLPLRLRQFIDTVTGKKH
ncbi:MAG TPA: hypothetical protein VFM69_02955 [Pricia sp.]|nr:hypothetical protein [Pricia sp.]